MKLPKFFRKSVPVSAIVTALAMGAQLFFASLQWSLLSTLAGFLFQVSLFVLVVSFIGMLVFRDIENALLRRFGEPATAVVLATAMTNERVNRIHVYRVKLEVRPSHGGSFEAVAEDVFRFANIPVVGNTVSVKFDPRTKEVAILLPGRTAPKKDDF